MKREGSQNGMVRTYQCVPKSINQTERTVNVIASIPNAGIFEKMKPVTHSKFTGKSGKVRPRRSDCHLMKCLNGDVSGMRLVTWRVVDARLGLGMSFGFETPSSASEILKSLDEGNEVVEDMIEMNGGDEIEIEEEIWMDGGDGKDDEDETMSFCEVGYVWEQADGDDDSWCLVAEM